MRTPAHRRALARYAERPADYWDLRAGDLYASYRGDRSDFALIGEIVDLVKPESVLDFGCGFGRYFGLYGAARIVGVDVSFAALRQIKKTPRISLVQSDGGALGGTAGTRFDLVVAGRALQHIVPSRIADTLARLTALGRNLFVAETVVHPAGGTDYLFLHDYESLIDRPAIRSGDLYVGPDKKTVVRYWLFGEGAR